ncbi:hypothetical protein C0J45_19619 [Silurus meridionalis]|nr:hypothetical protein C0J45_19619 [Silurus meridionalis]
MSAVWISDDQKEEEEMLEEKEGMSKGDRRTAGEDRPRTSERETGRKEEETRNGELNKRRIAQRITGNGNDKMTVWGRKMKAQ